MKSDENIRYVSAKQMGRLAQWTHRRPVIALMGEFSAGKSTLLNLLLGQSVLPTQVTATQLPPVWLRYGSEEPYRVDHSGNRHAVDLDNLMAVPIKETRFIRIYKEAEFLKTCDLLDTPGISDPRIAMGTWIKTIGCANAVLWCTHAGQAWRESERSAWESLPERLRKHSLLMVTRADKITSDLDLGKIDRRLERETADLFSGRQFISLTNAIQAREEDDDEAWGTSGAHDFLNSLNGIVETIDSERGHLLWRYQLDDTAEEDDTVEEQEQPIESSEIASETNNIEHFPSVTMRKPVRILTASHSNRERISTQDADRMRQDLSREIPDSPAVDDGFSMDDGVVNSFDEVADLADETVDLAENQASEPAENAWLNDVFHLTPEAMVAPQEPPLAAPQDAPLTEQVEPAAELDDFAPGFTPEQDITPPEQDAVVSFQDETPVASTQDEPVQFSEAVVTDDLDDEFDEFPADFASSPEEAAPEAVDELQPSVNIFAESAQDKAQGEPQENEESADVFTRFEAPLEDGIELDQTLTAETSEAAPAEQEALRADDADEADVNIPNLNDFEAPAGEAILADTPVADDANALLSAVAGQMDTAAEDNADLQTPVEDELNIASPADVAVAPVDQPADTQADVEEISSGFDLSLLQQKLASYVDETPPVAPEPDQIAEQGDSIESRLSGIFAAVETADTSAEGDYQEDLEETLGKNDVEQITSTIEAVSQGVENEAPAQEEPLVSAPSEVEIVREIWNDIQINYDIDALPEMSRAMSSLLRNLGDKDASGDSDPVMAHQSAENSGETVPGWAQIG